RPRSGTVPFYSTVVGGELDGQRLDSLYWWQNIRFPVLFQGAMDALVWQGFNLFVEVGPHPVLRSYVADALSQRELPGQVLGTLLRKDNSPLLLDRCIAKLLIAGAEPDWQLHFPVTGRNVLLPNYAWQRDRFQLPVSAESLGVLQRERVHP